MIGRLNIKQFGYLTTLLLALLLPAVSGIVVLKIQKKKIRKEVKQKIIRGISDDDLVYFVFSMEESKTLLDWKHNKEFVYQDEMYDIVRKEISGDSVKYWCWWDQEESRLERQLQKEVWIALGAHPQKKNHETKWKDFYKKLFCPNRDVLTYIIPLFESTSLHTMENTLATFVRDIPSPPPQPVFHFQTSLL
ncbi:MAG: hypothetical protein IPN79_16495 [Saprospiraceae bacterium]|nr:hypothetical protein [Saprospiraceae bacterium]